MADMKQTVEAIQVEMMDHLFDQGYTPTQVHAHLNDPMIQRGIELKAKYRTGTLDVAKHGVARLREILNDPTAPATY